MRARLDPMFSNYVLAVDNGLSPNTKDEIIKIPNGMLVPYDDDKTSLDHLIKYVFHNIQEYSGNMSTMMNQAILTPKNSFFNEIYALLIQRFPGEYQRYYSVDETIDKTEQLVMEDFLNTLTPNRIPPHELLLKKNCPMMLLKNINPSKRLCNGTLLICRAFDQNIIDAKIVVGHHMRKRVFIARIPFLPNVDGNSGSPFKRTQFSITLSFVMTINKSQGQTLDYVGIYLPQPAFSHGQLYVALSRAKTGSAVKILIRPGNRVQSVIFETDTNSREDTLKLFHSYYISDALVKNANPRYKIGTYEYDWTLNTRTLIEDVEEHDNQIEAPKYNIVPFTYLHSYKYSTQRIYFLAVAIQIKPTKEITTEFQQQTIQEIYLIDER
ncbi:uncharacterized protein LOC133796232 [Humulus lupulus]|uniref:uncharacterized protein LOC133796232 n=1 Tax=Humulus lupulus TaxID=3486 RepID=UPI002B40CE1B|nr:uncharacterized protein LOC133796232 [Humulus lupulus]